MYGRSSGFRRPREGRPSLFNSCSASFSELKMAPMSGWASSYVEEDVEALLRLLWEVEERRVLWRVGPAISVGAAEWLPQLLVGQGISEVVVGSYATLISLWICRTA